MKLEEMYAKPGHLIRRCHQIVVSLFHEECRAKRITPVQYAFLVALNSEQAGSGGLDQVSLAGLVAVDRSTASATLRQLALRGLVRRKLSTHDRRAKLLSITPAGRRLLESVRPSIERITERLLDPLTAAERRDFVRLLAKVGDRHNESSRVPLLRPDKD